MNQLDKKSYTVYLNSSDKVSGSNNNADYEVNWDDILPLDQKLYKLVFSFQTSGGYYKDNYSQFTISAVTSINTIIFKTNVTPTYNPVTGYTSIVLTITNGQIFYAGLYVVISGRNYLIIQGGSAQYDVIIIQGNPTILLNTDYFAVPYVSLTGNTSINYTGSLSIGQIVYYNNKSYTIGYLSNLNSTATTIIVTGGTASATILPLNTILYASNGTTYNGCKILSNFGNKTFSFDTSNKSQSLTIGYGFRDMQTSTSNSNCLSTFYMQNTPKTITRPNQNMINIKIYNNSNVYTNGSLQQNQLLVNTDYFSNPLTDMTNYSLILELIPID